MEVSPPNESVRLIVSVSSAASIPGAREGSAAAATGTARVKRGMADMLKGGVIMDVVTADQAKIAEDAGAVAVMALERVSADIRAQGGVARMSDPDMIEKIIRAVSIPLMAKCRIGHLAMTGMDTARMISSIMSGSLIRATPPSARISAGTRSSAITATAPASSAILACSGVTTSMITPPRSISARPRLTRTVPVVRCSDITKPLVERLKTREPIVPPPLAVPTARFTGALASICITCDANGCQASG